MFLWTDLVDLVRRPFIALRLIDARRRLADGLLALGLSVTLPAAVAEIAALGPFRPPANLGSLPSLTAQGADIYARWVYMHRFLIPVYGIGVSLVLWMAAAGLIHGIARALGGRGSFAGLLKLVGYAALVGVVALPGGLAERVTRDCDPRSLRDFYGTRRCRRDRADWRGAAPGCRTGYSGDCFDDH